MGKMITNKTIARIKDDEGLRLRPYRCSKGKLTIGWGFNLDANPIPVEVAELLLKHSLKTADSDARAIFRNFDSLSEARQGVLINMALQLGKSRLSGFKKFIAAVARSDWQAASKEMLDSKWAKEDTPERAERLANIFQRGEW